MRIALVVDPIGLRRIRHFRTPTVTLTSFAVLRPVDR